MENDRDYQCLAVAQTHSLNVIQQVGTAILPDVATLKNSRDNLLDELPDDGLGIVETTESLLQDVVPGFNKSSISPRYYGFVTGGITPAARVGETLVSAYDQNPQVHLPDQTVASNVEAKALDLLKDLFRFDRSQWSGVFTTGATTSNVLGLSLGREHVVNKAVERVTGKLNSEQTVGASGLLHACHTARVEGISIFTTKPHSSLQKAASIAGIGRNNVIDVGADNNGLYFDLEKLELAMTKKSQTHALIVAVSCGEINTGLFATNGVESVRDLRTLCDRYGAWLHVDGAFGLFARLLDGIPQFEHVASGASGLDLADSIAGDAHKLLNVPYDCGFFFHRVGNLLAEQVFQNPNAAYLSSSTASPDGIRSALNIGIENSRRLRGLPVYASLRAYGRNGYREMLVRQITLARNFASFINHHPAFELLPLDAESDEHRIQRNIFIIVLFKAKDERLNQELVQRVNRKSDVYLSGTLWDGKPASRLATANWQANSERDLPIIKDTLTKVLDDWKHEHTSL